MDLSSVLPDKVGQASRVHKQVHPLLFALSQEGFEAETLRLEKAF
jgi:hypothetical protein